MALEISPDQKTLSVTGYPESTDIPLERCDIIARMKEIAPPRQTLLDSETVDLLRDHTQGLLEIGSEEALAEYHRYIDAEQRELDIDRAGLLEVHKNQTIVVTGGTGLIGTVLMKELVKQQPAKVISISRGILTPLEVVDGVDYRYADVRDSQALDQIFDEVQPNIVYHAAAQKYPGLAEDFVCDTLSTNISGTKNVLAAVKAHNVERIIYASTGKTIRPFSPDTYASSKKVSEWLMAAHAAENDTLCSAARFTHVVDNSDLMLRVHKWIENDEPISLHGDDISMYVQSAIESAQLMMNSTLDAQKGNLQINAIRDLGWPVSLTNLALGAIADSQSRAAIYFHGYRPGYEEQSYIDLYDPLTAGEVSPLVSALEAKSARTSDNCSQVDTFLLKIESTAQLKECLEKLELACGAGQASSHINCLKDDLSWAMLEARLLSLPMPVVERAATRIQKRLAHTYDMPNEQSMIDQMILVVFATRQKDI